MAATTGTIQHATEALAERLKICGEMAANGVQHVVRRLADILEDKRLIVRESGHEPFTASVSPSAASRLPWVTDR